MNSKINILYLDDDRENLVGFAATFGKIYNIFTAQKVQQARQILSKTDIHLAIVDYKMPELNGIDFITIEQKKAPHIIFIIISAYTDSSIVIKAINQHNIYGYIQKPWNYDEVKIMLKNASNSYLEKIEKERLTTELQKTNKQLKQAIKNGKKAHELKNIFLENISHEIRTPLNSILGFNQLIANTSKSERISKYVEYSITAGYDLLNIIDSILEGSKLITDQIDYNMRKTSFNGLLHQAIEIVKQKRTKVPAMEIILAEDRDIYADHQKLTISIQNLLDNAIKFGDNGKINIQSQLTENTILLQIIDRGCGIEIEEVERIFEPFNQTRNKIFSPKNGLGMGLFIAKNHIENMKGQLKLSSHPGKGTCAQITLPTA